MGLFPENHYFSPNFIFKRFQKILEKCGTEYVMKKSKFQKEREAWIAALYLVGLSKNNNKEFWVGIEEVEETPDTYGVALRDIGKGNSLDKLNIEVCEWENHSQLSLSDHIKRKLKEKKYPNYFILLCYVHHRSGEKVDLDEIYKKIMDEKYNVSEIFVVASQQNNQYDHFIARLYPNRLKIEFNRQEEILRLTNQIDIISTSRGTEKTFTPLGLKEINLPEC